MSLLFLEASGQMQGAHLQGHFLTWESPRCLPLGELVFPARVSSDRKIGQALAAEIYFYFTSIGNLKKKEKGIRSGLVNEDRNTSGFACRQPNLDKPQRRESAGDTEGTTLG